MLTFIIEYQMKGFSIVRNWITSKAVILNYSEVAISRSHVLQKNCSEIFQKLFRNIRCRVIKPGICQQAKN